MNSLQQLKNLGTVIVVDTGEFSSIKEYKPQDSTTNPSLILKAVKLDEYRHLLDSAVKSTKSLDGAKDKQVESCMDQLIANFGVEILKIIPGRISTEMDARLSFDTNKTVEKARHIIDLYEKAGISKDRVLIKIASTWEGAQAAKILEDQGIHVNMTLMFSLPQAIIAAQAGATIISPFVGRILDWYKSNTDKKEYIASEDPGVLSVKEIYNYLKQNDHLDKPLVMGASFRNKEEIIELAGCDLLTISPKLLSELSNSNIEITPKLSVKTASHTKLPKRTLGESEFRWLLNENQMATEKLSDGIRVFAADTNTLEHVIKTYF